MPMSERSRVGMLPPTNTYALRLGLVHLVLVGPTYPRSTGFSDSEPTIIVGAAMKENPFAPFVPCHRVIASNLYIGGFYGEWGISKDSSNKRGQCMRKMKMLAEEGVMFTEDGFLKHQDVTLWKG